MTSALQENLVKLQGIFGKQILSHVFLGSSFYSIQLVALPLLVENYEEVDSQLGLLKRGECSAGWKPT